MTQPPEQNPYDPNTGGYQEQPEQPGYQQPGPPPPGYEQGGYQQPGYPQPGYEQGGYQQPGYPQPGYEQGAYQQGGYQQPGYPQQPGYQQPGYQQPGYEQGAYQQPGYEQGYVPQQYQQAYAAYGYGPVGQVRETLPWILLFIFTLGIAGFVWFFKVFEEMKQHTGTGLGGGLGLLVSLLGVGGFVSAYEAGQMYQRAGQAPPVSGWTGCW
ncbi:DUF4234 domain-containing protein, partial [Phytoactinopolyspora endophytica]|uniref:DUF4234 domain-containing protein n=1 Tax=Phytoactinopolyspora endophytica TaxID=1642495 RepID=UPI00197BB791